MSWLEEVFKVKKPVIAMCHFQALPGDPRYDQQKGLPWVIEKARADLLALQRGGVDAIMFSNEFSLPYLTKVEPITYTSMARVIGELRKDITVPYGVNVLWDPIASIDLAMAVDALFVREIFTGVYASDFGLWNTNCGEVVRHQYRLGAQKIKLLFNIFPEASVYLGGRNIADIAKSTVFNDLPDALCVSGLIAGAETDTSVLKQVKTAVPETTVFVNTGVRLDTVEEQLSIADGAVTGTTFKKDGAFFNPVDESRVKAFMDKVKDFRKNL
ncbi:sgc region protein SgcQ [Spirochaetia bacterium]|nr:sgc region protein SgcQ [Spirochaetia bacterium]